MKEKYPKYLPLGSVVLLEGASKRIMITGFCTMSDTDKSKIYDYCGCLYPEGIIRTDRNLVFNHEQISKIYALGYSDEEEKKFKEKLVAEINKIESEK